MQTWRKDLWTQQGEEKVGLTERQALIHTLLLLLLLLLSRFSHVRLCATS